MHGQSPRLKIVAAEVRGDAAYLLVYQVRVNSKDSGTFLLCSPKFSRQAPDFTSSYTLGPKVLLVWSKTTEER